MSRWLAGIFDPRQPADASAPVRALAGDGGESYADGGLVLAFSGTAAAETAPLCLFDGHLDNAAELRRQLDSLGSEAGGVEGLLAAGYRRWGAELLARLRGDFALLLWDPRWGRGLLARDQLGVRPLFVHERDGVLRFAGELRHLLALLPSRPAPDRAGVAHWIALSTRPGAATLYEGVERLGPGEALHLGPDGTRRERYWSPRFEEPLRLPPGQLAERVRSGMQVAVERRLAGVGGTGVLMSGGLDSASIAALAPQRLSVCSGLFPEHEAADEAGLIGELWSALGLHGLVADVRPGGLLAGALEHLSAWQAPQLGWGDFWALPLMRAAAARGVTTMLDGDGGDELFGPRVYALADRLRAGRPRQVLKLARRLPGVGNIGRREKAKTVARLTLSGAAPALPPGLLQLPLERRRAPGWLPLRTLTELVGSDDPGAWKRLRGPRWWASAAYGVTQAIEQTGLYEHQRRRAALVGIEARHPMLDLDLVELCLRQPPEETLDPRFNRPVLRAAMAGRLPDSVRLRPAKALFESLIVSCLTDADGAAVRAILCAPRAELGEYVDLAAMRDSLFENDAVLRAEPFRWMWYVWRLLNMELWLRSQSGAIPLLEPNYGVSETRIAIREG